MSSWRIFVTLYMFLGIVTVVACHHDTVEKTPNSQAKVSQKNDAYNAPDILEGNSKIQKAFAIKSELLNKFGIDLGANKARLTSAYRKWRKLSKSQRMELKADLAEFQSLINRVLELDASGKMYVTKKEQITNALEKAEIYQHSIDRFEKKFGQNYDPAGFSI